MGFPPNIVYLVFYASLQAGWISLEVWEIFLNDFIENNFYAFHKAATSFPSSLLFAHSIMTWSFHGVP